MPKVVQRTKPHVTSSYRCLLITQKKVRIFYFTIPIDDLFPYCFVSRREEDPVAGFQRTLNETRAEDIAQYLSEGPGSIPSNIVLSAQSVASLRYDPRAVTVSFTPAQNAFLVMDGQHRLWGYDKCPIRHRVPVAVYSGLSRAMEARLFIDINTNQRGVPAALLLDIKQLAEIESANETVLRDLFDKLHTDPKSPLAGKLSAAKSAAGLISRVTFNRALSNVLSASVLSEGGPALRYRMIVNYLNAFDAELPDKNKSWLSRASYFEAIFDLLDEVVRQSLQEYKNAKQESLQKVVRPLAQLVFATGRGALPTKKVIAQTMQATLRENVVLSEEML